MAVIECYSCETQAATSENQSWVFTGTAAFSTVQARTGVASVRCNPASGVAGSFSVLLSNQWMHFGFYVASRPTLSRVIAGAVATSTGNIVLNSDGTLSVRNNTTVLGTTAVLTTGRWYWIGWRNKTDGATAVLLQVDAVDAITATSPTLSSGVLGVNDTAASAIDVYFDDIMQDDTAFLNPSRVGLAVPISDNAVGAGWTLGTGTAISANSGSTAVKNTPPLGVADLAVGSDVKQIRNAAANLNAYAANLTTYATLGITQFDTILALWPFAMTAAPSATSAKSGSLTLSNPTIAKATFGTFYNGSAIAGTFPTGWVRRQLGLINSATPTLASSPVLTVTQDTSSTRIADVCFMGMQVAWTPGALNKVRTAMQAVKRASSY